MADKQKLGYSAQKLVPLDVLYQEHDPTVGSFGLTII